MPIRFVILLGVMLTVGSLAGCRATQRSAESTMVDQQPSGNKKIRKRTVAPRLRIRKVYCLYDASPWLNLDRYGDRDPEGIQYRVFLSPGDRNTFKKGILQKGTFHIEMFGVTRDSKGTVTRELVSDWHYPVDTFSAIESKYSGRGYHIKLRWARKDLAGQDIEIITEFEDVDGFTKRSATKSFPIPKYTS